MHVTQQIENASTQRLFSLIIVYETFLYKVLWSLSTNIDENKFCSKNIDRIFEKINTRFPSYIKKWAMFAWLINYFAIGNLLCDKLKNSSENKNHDVNENLRVTIKFGAYTFLRWYLKKKNCKHKYHDVEVKSLKRWLTLGLLLKPGPGPPKKLDPEKHGSWETWNKYEIKKTSLPLESLMKKMCNVICSLKVCLLTSISKLNFSG